MFLCKVGIQDPLPATPTQYFHTHIDEISSGITTRSGQVRGHTAEQRVAASTLRRYYFDLRLTIAQADARPAMSISLRKASVCPSPRQTPSPPCPYSSYRTPPDATMKRVDVWTHHLSRIKFTSTSVSIERWRCATHLRCYIRKIQSCIMFLHPALTSHLILIGNRCLA